MNVISLCHDTMISLLSRCDVTTFIKLEAIIKKKRLKWYFQVETDGHYIGYEANCPEIVLLSVLGNEDASEPSQSVRVGKALAYLSIFIFDCLVKASIGL